MNPLRYSQKNAHQELNKTTRGIVESDELLNNGFLPRNMILWMAVFYMALFIIRPWEKLFPAIAYLHPERIYAICMILAVILSKRKSFKFTYHTLTVLFFLASIILTGLFAHNPALAFDSINKYISIIVFYFILLSVISTPYSLVFMVLCYIIIMGLYIVKSQWEYFIHGRHEYRMGVFRLIGIEDTFGGPNALAMSIIVSLPFALFLWTNRSIISDSWPSRMKIMLNIGLIIYSIFALTAIILTNSRSGMVAFVLYVAILGVSCNGVVKKIKYSFVTVILLSLLWSLMPEESKGRFQTIWAPEQGPSNAQISAEGRIEGFKAGMEMFSKFPVTGVGPGNFIPYRVMNLDGVPLEAHNLAGQLLGEMGVVGGFSFLLMLLAIQSASRKVIAYSKQQSDSVVLMLADLASACRMSLFLLIFLGLFGHNLYRANWLWIMAFSILALRFTQDRLANTRIV